jgi:hypothetical protein
LAVQVSSRTRPDYALIFQETCTIQTMAMLDPGSALGQGWSFVFEGLNLSLTAPNASIDHRLAHF